MIGTAASAIFTSEEKSMDRAFYPSSGKAVGAGFAAVPGIKPGVASAKGPSRVMFAGQAFAGTDYRRSEGFIFGEVEFVNAEEGGYNILGIGILKVTDCFLCVLCGFDSVFLTDNLCSDYVGNFGQAEHIFIVLVKQGLTDVDGIEVLLLDNL